jgi:N-acetylneuraminate synthase
LGTLARAIEAVDAAADSSVDAIKLARMPWEWSAKLFERAEQRGIAMLATVLDESAIERLDWLGAPAFYLTFDWSDLDLVARAAQTGKPLVIQVGTASPHELAEVIATARANGGGGIALVQSVLDSNLEGLDELHRHGAVLGILDRSACSEIPRAAILGGASIVEKRFKLRPDGNGLDRVAELVRDCEQTWASMSDDPQWTVN